MSKTFLQQLQQQFEDCLKILNPGSINRDRLWESFFILHSSNKAWNDFFLTAKVNPIPTLYQQLTCIMFCQEIRKWSHTIWPLTDDEGNALRYTAGYICRHLRKQLKRSNHEMKEELILCLM